MQLILQIIIGTLFGVALFMILADLLKVPTKKTVNSVSGMAKQIKGDESDINAALERLAIGLSKIIRINEYKRTQMVADLFSARMDISPEMFTANAIVKAGVFGIIGVPFLFVAPAITLLIIAIAVVLYFNEMRSLPGRLKKKRQAIEYELPRLVFTIEKTLRHSRDIIYMLSSYADVAGPDMKHELDITVADMKSGNYETAIARLESRVGSPMMSDVCRGLISIMRGDDTTVFWHSLELKFEDHQRELLKIEANKIPRKVRRLSMVMMICFILTWVVVIAVQIIQSLGTMF